MTLYEMITWAMVKKHISPTELQRRCGLSNGYYYSIKTYKRSPRFDAIVRIADELDLDMNDLAHCEDFKDDYDLEIHSKLYAVFNKVRNLDKKEINRLITLIYSLYPQLFKKPKDNNQRKNNDKN